MIKSTDSIFMTGVTGTLGKEFIQKLLAESEAKIYLLVRRSNKYSHWDRIRRLLQDWGLESNLGTRVHVLEGDVTLESFGLSQEDQALLAREVTHFFHIAALTALNGSEVDCFKINLGGTQNAINLAWDLRNHGKLKRFFYFSTAYVAGSLQSYVAKEEGLPDHPAHANYYESSKYNAEKHVRAAMLEGLPVTIFRPSIVVGDSKTGKVSEFNVIYPFIKLFSSGILKVLPTHLENSFNIVPIDFVVDAAFEISTQEESIGKTYHLVNGEPPQIGSLISVKDESFPDFPKIQIVAPENFSKESFDPMQQSVYDVLEPYLGYLNDHLSFDMTNTREALKGTSVSLPDTNPKFLKTLIQYAVDAGYLVTP